MAVVKQVSVEAAITLNLGNYQSARVSAGAVLELQEGDKAKAVYEQAFDMVTNEIDKQLDDIKTTINGPQKSGAKRGL